MNGIIVIDKPDGFTSFDAVAVARRCTGVKKIGHTGTLDPMATGVLPLLVGRAAKAADLLPDTSKTYTADFQFGRQTDTADRTGTLLREKESHITSEELKAVLPRFRGDVQQVPPMYSAVSVAGQRLYSLARKGIEVKRTARWVHIDALSLLEFDEGRQTGRLQIACGKGTYIRTLIEDIAAALNNYGVMTALRRTAACGFHEKDAVTPEQLKEAAKTGTIHTLLQPTELLFEDLRAVQLSQAQTVRFQNGGALDAGRLKTDRPFTHEEKLRVYTAEHTFLAVGLYQKEKHEVKLLKLFFMKDDHNGHNQ